MAKGRSGASNSHRQTAAVRGRRALNAFRIDKNDSIDEAAAQEEMLEEGEDGQVKSEDDEDIDSDEAFDESDEERFSTFKFSGSSAKGRQQKVRFVSTGSMDEEDEEEEGDDEADDETYMDLSEMLAQGQSSRKPVNKSPVGRVTTPSEDDYGSTDEEEDSDESDESILEDSGSENSEDGDGRLDNLGVFVENLRGDWKEPEAISNTELPESTSKVSTSLSMNDILSSLTDPSLQSLRKSLETRQSSTSKSAGQKLSAPLAKNLQKKLERQAAYEETKAEITKWQPIVKANREADHLHFPMDETPKQSKQTSASLAGTFEPSSSLEKTIDSLLRESGLRSEKEISSFEDLALKKVSIDEVRQRQAQLRTMRELMFRQDQKAKRIAKIKSKTYRRIHKKEREREMARQALEEGSDGEEAMERKMKVETARAKERMTLRHKNTGAWATKMLSRGQRDLETRQAISEQIRRGDELKRKVLGDEEEEEVVESDSEEDLEELIKDPSKWGEDRVTVDQEEIRKGVMGMKFMRDAEERQKQTNAKDLAEIKASLNEGSEDAEDPETLETNPPSGRKMFVPGDKGNPSEQSAANRDDKGAGEEVHLKIVKNPFHMSEASRISTNKTTSTSRMASADEVSETVSSKQQANPWLSFSEKNLASTNVESDTSVNPWLATPYKKPSKNSNSDNRIERIQNKRKRHEQANEEDAQINIDVSIEAINSKLKATDPQAEQDEETANMTYGRGRIAFQQQELINRAFAGDGFEQDFALEKEAAITEDAPKQEDLTLPGWGSWTGQGVKRRATEKMLIKNVPGIDASKRKDAKLKNVIINEKTVKKHSRYLAGAVPYPFETREQYERSLNMSVGPEWTTREMYQKMTKPRVTIRAGTVVNPLVRE